MSAVPPPLWVPTNTEYHSTPGRWSSSRISTFMESPWEAFQRYVLGNIEPDPPNTAMSLGAAVSQALTDTPDVGQHCYRVAVEGRGAKAFKQAEQAFPDRIVLTAPEYERVEGMVEAIHNPKTPMAETARALMVTAPGFREYAHQWEDAETGVPLMVKWDRLVWLDGIGVVGVELKTSADPSPEGFTKTANRFGYHRQGRLYQRGAEDRMKVDGADQERVPVYYVVVGSDWPHDVCVYVAGSRYLTAGEAELKDALRRLAACLADPSGKLWHHRWEMAEVIPTLDVPRWVKVDEENMTVTETGGGW